MVNQIQTIEQFAKKCAIFLDFLDTILYDLADAVDFSEGLDSNQKKAIIDRAIGLQEVVHKIGKEELELYNIDLINRLLDTFIKKASQLMETKGDSEELRDLSREIWELAVEGIIRRAVDLFGKR